jgi:hypothetical protein
MRTSVSLSAMLGVVALVAASAVNRSGPVTALPGEHDLDRALQVQRRHLAELLARPGVVGVGVGQAPDGTGVLRPYLALPVVDLPASLDGVPVEPVVTGMITARSCVSGPASRCQRPVPIGVSTGHPDVTAGTLGVRVTNGRDVFALSNNHVYAVENEAAVGDRALQPGPYDGGIDPGDAIGTLFDFEPIRFDPEACDPVLGPNDPDCNLIDAAIAVSSPDLLGTATLPDGYGAPSGASVEASPGRSVMKYGRTTGLTAGEIAEVHAVIEVCYDPFFFFCLKAARFVEQVGVGPGTFSQPGDSGSLIVTQGEKRPVALLFAGSAERTFANPIGPVLRRFGVAIDGVPDLPPSPGDADGDGCRDDAESALMPPTNPTNPWDFYSVPVPAPFASSSPAEVKKDAAVTAQDAQTVFAYAMRSAKAGTALYEQDLNGNGVKDGWEYDRVVLGASPPDLGSPDGVVTAEDAQKAFSQAMSGYDCRVSGERLRSRPLGHHPEASGKALLPAPFRPVVPKPRRAAATAATNDRHLKAR